MASVNEEADIDFTDPTNDPSIDGILDRFQWSKSAVENFQFTITDHADDYRDTRDGLIDDYPDDVYHEVEQPSDQFIAAVRRAIAQYTAILPFAITEQPDNDQDVQLRFGVSDFSGTDVAGVPAYTHSPVDDDSEWGSEQGNWVSGDMFFNRDNYEVMTVGGTPAKEVVGSHDYLNIMHEIGHALGLKHGHEAGGGYPALPAQWDTGEFTIMTYRAYPGAPTNSYHTLGGNDPQTLMMLDIAAIQHLYGASFTGPNSGDTVYSWKSDGTYSIDGTTQWKADTGKIYLTVWDPGGVDTYDFSNLSKNQSIDLTPGGWSNLGSNLAKFDNGSFARGNVFNARQYEDDPRSLIENAIAGAGDDTVTGNFANNTLDGGAGKDRIDGNLGDDVLIGGAGADTLLGSLGFDRADYSASVGEIVTITALAGASAGRWTVGGAAQATGDKLSGIEAFRFGQFGDQVDCTLPSDGFAITIDGDAGNDTLIGGRVGTYTFTGSAGDDFLGGGSKAVDVFDGGTGDDTLSASTKGADTLVGNAGSDELVAYAGVFDADGWAPGETLLADRDHLTIDRSSLDGAVALSYLGIDSAAGTGTFTASDGSVARHIYSVTYFGSSGSDYGVGGGSHDDSLVGNAGDDNLFGGGGNDTLDGGDGTDHCYGEAGDDLISGGGEIVAVGGGVMDGGAGNDTLIGSDAAETMNGQADNDSLDARGGNDFLYGETGLDTLNGGDGDDQIYGNAGGKIVNGGSGYDVLTLSRYGTTLGVSITVNSRAGSDGTKTTGIEQFDLQAGEGADTVTSAEGNDHISGNGGDDRIDGGAGVDVIDGGDGNDTIIGGLGMDVLYGGAGNDKIITDQFESNFGGTGNDTILGTAGADALGGDEDNDKLFGYGGADSLFGGTGSDTLDGGAGNDNLYGDNGNVFADHAGDTFVMGSGYGEDTLDGFSAHAVGGSDVIDMTAFHFKSFAKMLAAGVTITQGSSYTVVAYAAEDMTAVISRMTDPLSKADFLL